MVTPDLSAGDGSDGWRDNGGTSAAVSSHSVADRMCGALSADGLLAFIRIESSDHVLGTVNPG